MIGPARLASYGQIIHRWADGFREWGWPRNTPDYLLFSYPLLLIAYGDLKRLVRLVTDPARHLLMRQRSGDDTAALAEVDLALTAAASDPKQVERLTRHRETLA